MTNIPKEFIEALHKYVVTIAGKFKQPHTIGGQPEAQLVAPVEALLGAARCLIGQTIAITNESAIAEHHSRPDFAISSSGLLRGHVELKAPGKGA